MTHRLVVCFDFEGAYGMPFPAPYDLDAATAAILGELAAHRAHAVFFVVGRLIEDRPDIVTALAAAGHEIGVHGYEHDDLAGYDADRVAWLEQRLTGVADRLEALVGHRPRGFRAPYLLGPHFYRADLYQVLRRTGFSWVSNREVRYPAELLRPGRLPLPGRPRAAGDDFTGPAARLADSRALLALLNAGLLARESFGGTLRGRLAWLTGERAPFVRDGLTEVPLYSALDCDLVGLPDPRATTPPELLGYAGAYLRRLPTAPGTWAMATFHDWIVAGGNRLGLLTAVLAAANQAGVVLSTPQDQPQWLNLAEPGPTPATAG